MNAQALPAGALLLHIGPQKTGSTAQQVSMHEGRDELAAQGVHYAGSGMRPREAGWAVMQVGASVGRPAPRPEQWTDLVAEIAASPHPRICVSNEDFGRADDAAVERILAGTGAERTHLLYVARRLDKLLPSHWQERVKARMTLDYDAFLHHVLDDPTRDWEARMMWESHDVAAVLARWGKHLPPERMTVIVSDERDRELIPRTFEQLLALAPGTLKPGVNANTSMSYTQTEAVRNLNVLARDQEWSPQEYWRIIQAGVVSALRATPDPDGPAITGLPQWAYPMVAERSEAQVAAIRAAGVQVVGDVQHLLVAENAVPSDLPEPISEIRLDLVADLVRGAVTGAERLHRNRLRTALRAFKNGPDAAVSGRTALGTLRQRTVGRMRRGN